MYDYPYTCNDILIIFGNDLEIKRIFQYQNIATTTLDVTYFVKAISASFGSTCTKHGTKHFLQKALYILNRKNITIDKDHIFKFKLNQRTTV